MSEAGAAKPKKGGKKKASPASAAKEEVQQPMPPFKPGKLTHYDRQVVDYVRTATAKNIWYYRCAGGVLQGAWRTAMAPMRAQAGRGKRGARLPPLPPGCRSELLFFRGAVLDHLTIPRNCHVTAALLSACCRDRLSTPRGPCSLPVLREAWTQGVIDANTLVWGQVRLQLFCTSVEIVASPCSKS